MFKKILVCSSAMMLFFSCIYIVDTSNAAQIKPLSNSIKKSVFLDGGYKQLYREFDDNEESLGYTVSKYKDIFDKVMKGNNLESISSKNGKYGKYEN